MSKLLLHGILQQAKNQAGGGSSGDWDYEGVMTVGSDGSYSAFGYDLTTFSTITGDSINPPDPQVSGFNEALIILWSNYPFVTIRDGATGSRACNVAEINGVTFDFEAINNRSIIGVPNPFPPAGQTCTIKLK